MKPLIGINADYRSATKTASAFSFVAAGYSDSVSRAGGNPIIIPPRESVEDLNELLDHLAGVVLVGGLDLDPRLDGYMLHPAVRPMDSRREGFDRTLAWLIMERRIPVFGIGVGMQLMNVVAGGTLHLHLPEDRPRAMPHLDPFDRGHRHAIDVEPGSIVHRVYMHREKAAKQMAVGYVTSCHHQAIDDVAPAFRVTAASSDGIVEAVESVDLDAWFAFGTQFHPESTEATEVDQLLFEEFVTGAT